VTLRTSRDWSREHRRGTFFPLIPTQPLPEARVAALSCLNLATSGFFAARLA
jgi:hypothetical protein